MNGIGFALWQNTFPIPYRKTKPRHRKGDEEIHIGIHREGQYPLTEAKCRCRKAPCGLVVQGERPCQYHDGSRPIVRHHSAADCRERIS